ncbi:hypothetical protein HDU83_009191 [Entophlyctis luteolus]|nr:hypothetical protein HDU83_009191 [Entophlyctis luteolus]
MQSSGRAPPAADPDASTMTFSAKLLLRTLNLNLPTTSSRRAFSVTQGYPQHNQRLHMRNDLFATQSKNPCSKKKDTRALGTSGLQVLFDDGSYPLSISEANSAIGALQDVATTGKEGRQLPPVPPPRSHARRTRAKHLRTDLLQTERAEIRVDWWVLASHFVTCCFPPTLIARWKSTEEKDVKITLQKVKDMSQAIQDWREKIASCLIIAFMMTITAFFTVGLQFTFCPSPPDTALNSVFQNDHKTLKYQDHVVIFGNVYDFNATAAILQEYASIYLNADFISSDLTPLFLASACQSFANNSQINSCSVPDKYGGPGITTVCLDPKIVYDRISPSSHAYFSWSDVNSNTRSPHTLLVYNSAVLNLTNYLVPNRIFGQNGSVDQIIESNLGLDATRAFAASYETISAANCLAQRYIVGYVDQASIGCSANQFIQGTILAIITTLILVRFLMAFVFHWCISARLTKASDIHKRGRRRGVRYSGRPPASVVAATSTSQPISAVWQNSRRLTESPEDPYVVMLVTCYSEDRAGIRKTVDSLACTDYSDKRKLLFVVADGIVQGSGQKDFTSDIVKSLVEPMGDEEAGDDAYPMDYFAIADKMNQHNRAKVFAGYFTSSVKGKVPIVAIVKCGNPTEDAKAKLNSGTKPGNRGKRDSQMILMNFFASVSLPDARMTSLEFDLATKIERIAKVSPSAYSLVLMVDADTKVLEESLFHMVQAMRNNTKIMGLCGETRIENESASWVTKIQVFEYYISHHLGKAFESVFGGVTCLPGISMTKVFEPFAEDEVPIPGQTHKTIPLLIDPEIILNYKEFILELIGTVVLPVAVTLMFVLIFAAFTSGPSLPLYMLIITLFLPAVLILTTTMEFKYVFWMVVYLAALPVWNFALPLYAFWNFDDVSWGETRKVQGEEISQGHLGTTEEYMAGAVITRTWDQWKNHETSYTPEDLSYASIATHVHTVLENVKNGEVRHASSRSNISSSVFNQSHRESQCSNPTVFHSLDRRSENRSQTTRSSRSPSVGNASEELNTPLLDRILHHHFGQMNSNIASQASFPSTIQHSESPQNQPANPNTQYSYHFPYSQVESISGQYFGPHFADNYTHHPVSFSNAPQKNTEATSSNYFTSASSDEFVDRNYQETFPTSFCKIPAVNSNFQDSRVLHNNTRFAEASEAQAFPVFGGSERTPTAKVSESLTPAGVTNCQDHISIVGLDKSMVFEENPMNQTFEDSFFDSPKRNEQSEPKNIHNAICDDNLSVSDDCRNSLISQSSFANFLPEDPEVSFSRKKRFGLVESAFGSIRSKFSNLVNTSQLNGAISMPLVKPFEQSAQAIELENVLVSQDRMKNSFVQTGKCLTTHSFERENPASNSMFFDGRYSEKKPSGASDYSESFVDNRNKMFVSEGCALQSHRKFSSSKFENNRSPRPTSSSTTHSQQIGSTSGNTASTANMAKSSIVISDSSLKHNEFKTKSDFGKELRQTPDEPLVINGSIESTEAPSRVSARSVAANTSSSSISTSSDYFVPALASPAVVPVSQTSILPHGNVAKCRELPTTKFIDGSSSISRNVGWTAEDSDPNIFDLSSVDKISISMDESGILAEIWPGDATTQNDFKEREPARAHLEVEVEYVIDESDLGEHRPTGNSIKRSNFKETVFLPSTGGENTDESFLYEQTVATPKAKKVLKPGMNASGSAKGSAISSVRQNWKRHVEIGRTEGMGIRPSRESTGGDSSRMRERGGPRPFPGKSL